LHRPFLAFSRHGTILPDWAGFFQQMMGKSLTQKRLNSKQLKMQNMQCKMQNGIHPIMLARQSMSSRAGFHAFSFFILHCMFCILHFFILPFLASWRLGVKDSVRRL
jgi:hypothetical protein